MLDLKVQDFAKHRMGCFHANPFYGKLNNELVLCILHNFAYSAGQERSVTAIYFGCVRTGVLRGGQSGCTVCGGVWSVCSDSCPLSVQIPFYSSLFVGIFGW